PHLLIQAFMKTLTDLQGVPYQKHLSQQFSIAFDLFLEIRNQVNHCIQKACGRDTPNWRLKHACPACTYTLKDEPTIEFKLLYVMDGNNSLKRVISTKYPLAVVEKLLDVFSKGLGGGFDISCKFKTTLSNSPLGRRARNLNHTCLVGSFHGHAHRHLCQLDHLATYVNGLGLEDLEG
ncbi:hypothetical protein SERLA73DRAFT_34185, partial [Serpula lacrymans var. lacrymans S7.3]